MKPKWTVKQQGTSLDIYLYDDITADEKDWWSGEKIESETSAGHIQRVIQEAGAVSAINVYINSYGGDVAEGIAIYNQLKRHTAQKTVYIDGFACSIASVIAMVGDKVVMGANALMMIHNASWGAWGTSVQLRKAADDLDVINSASVSSYRLKAKEKLPEDVLKQLLDSEKWLTAEQCLGYGLVDEIAGAEAAVAIQQAKQRLKSAQEAEMMQLSGKNNPRGKVPESKQTQKTNAEKLMAAFQKKMEE